MKVDFKNAWGKLCGAIDAALAPAGLVRIDDEVLVSQVEAGCVAAIRVSPRSRTVVDGSINVIADVGLNYPLVDDIYRDLWVIEKSRSPTDLYCPLSCQISSIDKTMPVFGLKVPISGAEGEVIEMFKSVVSDVIGRDVMRLANLNCAISEMRSPESPWYNALAYKNFLPAALLYLSRPSEAVAVAHEVLSSYRKSSALPARLAAYAKFAARVELMAKEFASGKSGSSGNETAYMGASRIASEFFVC